MSSGISGFCATYATRLARSRSAIVASTSPSTLIVPVEATSPAAARSNDDLPAPFGPITPTHSPDSTRSVNASTATRVPYDTVTLRNSMLLIR